MRSKAAFIAGAGSAAIVAVGVTVGSGALTASTANTASNSTSTTGAINGTFHGEKFVDDEGWGDVQVDLVFTDGKITDVIYVSAKATHGRDQAFPILRQETLDAQKAEVATVGGATFTSLAYIKSVQSALDAAGFTG